ncbi:MULTISPECIES: hypothetical protein [unclassified Sphingobium]|nr:MULTISPECIES: hypothetical protein [unclassified Sphingobium]
MAEMRGNTMRHGKGEYEPCVGPEAPDFIGKLVDARQGFEP